MLDGLVCIGWHFFQKPVIVRREALIQVVSGRRGGGGQPSFPEELLACRGPDGVGEKEVLQLAKPLAARDLDVAAFDFITQSRQHGTFIGTAIAGTIGANQGPEAFGHTTEWEVLW